MRFKKIHTVLTMIAVISLLAVPAVQAVTSEPGSDADPIVTKSYVDEQTGILAARIDSLADEVDKLTEQASTLTKQLEKAAVTITELTAKVADLESKLSGSGNGGSKFEVIKLTKGQQLIAGASAEIILRSGSATAIAGEFGGLADVSSDKSLELMTGDSVPLNHLLIVSRDDGRGIKIESNEAYLLFKGEYAIK